MADQLTAVDTGTRTWFKPLLMATLVTSAFGNIAGLTLASSVYGQETTALADAALAQDAGTLGVCMATMLVMMRTHHSGFRELVGLGVAGFLAYNAVIYCFDITFGPLFLVWTMVLGLSVFTLASGFRLLVTGGLSADVHRTVFAPGVMMTVATLFSLLWLGEIVIDLLVGDGSTSAAAWRVPTNPVHVLDLAVALPAAFVTGVAMLQRRPLGVLATPAVLTFLIMMSIPIVLTPVSSTLQAHPAAWASVPPVLAIAVLCSVALWRSLPQDPNGPS